MKKTLHVKEEYMVEEVIKFDEILYCLKSKWKFIVCVTLTTTVLAAVVSFFIIKPKYQSSIKLFIGKEIGESNENYSNSDVEMYQKLMRTYSEVITTRDLISKALIKNNIFTDVDEALKNITIVTSTDTQVLQIKYKSIDPYEANNIVNAVKNTFIVRAKELIPNGNIQVIEESKVAESPVSPNRLLNICIGFLLGFILSIGLIALSLVLDNSFKNKDEVEKMLGISVIGTIPLVDRK